MQPTMNTAITAEATGRLSAMPPWFSGLSRKSPTVAPSGRVRMNADPEQRDARNVRPIVKGCDDDQRNRKHQCAAFVAETCRVGDPVPERRSQRLGERDGGPVKCFNSPVGTRSPPRSNLGKIPERERSQQQSQKERGASQCNRYQANGRRNRPWWCRMSSRRRSLPQYRNGWKRFARICAATRMTSAARKIAVPVR